MSRSISTPRDLEDYGISYLTGEADAWGVTALYQVTEQGKRIVLSTLGLPDTTAFLRYDGSYTIKGSPIVGLVYLGHRFALTELAICALIEVGCHTVVEMNSGSIYGFEARDSDHDIERFMTLHTEWNDVKRVYAPVSGQPRVGRKSVSAFTGTTV